MGASFALTLLKEKWYCDCDAIGSLHLAFFLGSGIGEALHNTIQQNIGLTESGIKKEAINRRTMHRFEEPDLQAVSIDVLPL